MTKKRFNIKGMHCVGCAMTIDGALEDMQGVKEARTNYARQSVEVEYDERTLTDADLIEAIRVAGYQAESEALPKG